MNDSSLIAIWVALFALVCAIVGACMKVSDTILLVELSVFVGSLILAFTLEQISIAKKKSAEKGSGAAQGSDIASSSDGLHADETQSPSVRDTMADFDIVLDKKTDNLAGLWLRDPKGVLGQPFPFQLMALLTMRCGVPSDLAANICGGGYRVVPNTVDRKGGAFVMFDPVPYEPVNEGPLF